MKHLVQISVISALLLTITGCGTTYELAHQCIEGDCINGEGTLTWAGGDQYIGEFKDGKQHGQGTYTWSDQQYVGEWKDDDKHGQGTLTWADGDQYVGDFVNGKRTGQGTYTDVNGNQYIGEWKDGMKHGQGTFP